MVNWAELHPDILLVIAKLLFSSEEFKALVAFGGVCTSWRSVWILLKKHLKQSPLKVVWLMLAEEEGLSQRRGLSSLSKCNIHYINFPEAKGKQLFSFPEGWMITAGLDFELTLVHMLSRFQFELPSWRFNFKVIFQAFFPNVNGAYCPNLISRAALTANPSSTPNFKIVITYESGAESIVAFASPGDKAWTVLRKGMLMADVVCYEGKIYGIDWDGTFWLCDVEASKPTLTKLFPRPEGYGYAKAVYLVESSGKLLAVFRNWLGAENIFTYTTTGFEVFELDWNNGSWTQVNCLGNRALFVGRNASFSVDASNVLGCEADSIYYTNDCEDAYLVSFQSYEERESLRNEIDKGDGKDMGVYYMKDQTLKPHFPYQYFSCITPPLWVVPDFP